MTSTPAHRDSPALASAGPWLPAAVIFDCDGVLVDSEPLSCRVASTVLGWSGVEMAPDECHLLFTGGAGVGMRKTVERQTGRPLPDTFEDDYVAELEAAYRRELGPNPGAIDLIGQLRSHALPYGVASNGTRATTMAALDAAGLAHLFEGSVFTSEDVPRGKPAPDLFLRAAASLGAAPPACLVLEDSPVGIDGARAAGMTVWALMGTYPAAALTRADRIFTSLVQMTSALGLGDGDHATAEAED
jgi:HAD superfamily hydrolase (TIGR01509 family)